MATRKFPGKGNDIIYNSVVTVFLYNIFFENWFMLFFLFSAKKLIIVKSIFRKCQYKEEKNIFWQFSNNTDKKNV